MGEELEDPIVEKVPVFLNSTNSGFFSLLRFPTAGSDSSFFEEPESQWSVKTENRLLQVSIPLHPTSDNPHYSQEMGRSLAGDGEQLMQSLCFSSVECPIPEPLTYLVGLRSAAGDAIYLAPLSQVHHLQPSFKHIDDCGSLSKQQATRKPAEEPEAKTVALKLSYKRQETEEEIEAKLRSFAHYQRIVAEEQWASFSFGKRAAEALLRPTATTWLQFSPKKSRFLEQTIAGDDGPAHSTVPLYKTLGLASDALRIKTLMQNCNILSLTRIAQLLNYAKGDRPRLLHELEKIAFLIHDRWVLRSELYSLPGVVIHGKDAIASLLYSRNFLLGLLSSSQSGSVTRAAFWSAIRDRVPDSWCCTLLQSLCNLKRIPGTPGGVWHLRCDPDGLSDTSTRERHAQQLAELFASAHSFFTK